MTARPNLTPALLLLTGLVGLAGLAACAGGGSSTPPPAFGAPVLLWANGGCFASWCQTGWYGSPAVADIDGDGALEVVWASYDLVALKASDGSLKWREAATGRSWGGPVVADLDGDGHLEIAAAHDDSVSILGGAGNLKASVTPFASGEVRTLAAGDVAGDGKLELVAGRAAGPGTGQVTVLDHAGAPLAGWPGLAAGAPGYGWGLYNQNVALGDLLGTGKRQVVAPSDVHYVMAFAGDGSQLPANARYGAGKVWSQVGANVDDAADVRGWTECATERRFNFADAPASIADLDGDGTREVVIVGNAYDCSVDPYLSLYRGPIILKADRSRWAAGPYDWTVLPAPKPGSGPRSEDWSVIETALSNPVLADLDGDGVKEILYASYDGRVHAWWLDKTQHGGWPYAVTGGGLRFASEPAVADLDGDGKAEVILTTWTETAGTAVGSLVILDWQGRQLFSVALPPSRSQPGRNGALGAPTLANLDAGPELEVLVGTVSSGVVAYRIPGSVSTGIRWGTGRGNYRRDGTGP